AAGAPLPLPAREASTPPRAEAVRCPEDFEPPEFAARITATSAATPASASGAPVRLRRTWLWRSRRAGMQLLDVHPLSRRRDRGAAPGPRAAGRPAAAGAR